MWRPGSTRLFDGSERNLDASEQVSDRKSLSDTIPTSAPSSNYIEIPLQHEQLIESSPRMEGLTTLPPLMLCESLKERWLESSSMKLCFCDRIRILLGVRIASLFGASGEIVAALTVLVVGIWIWNFKVVEAQPQTPSHPKELSIPQYCDCSSSTIHRGWGRR